MSGDVHGKFIFAKRLQEEDRRAHQAYSGGIGSGTCAICGLSVAGRADLQNHVESNHAQEVEAVSPQQRQDFILRQFTREKKRWSTGGERNTPGQDSLVSAAGGSSPQHQFKEARPDSTSFASDQRQSPSSITRETSPWRDPSPTKRLRSSAPSGPSDDAVDRFDPRPPSKGGHLWSPDQSTQPSSHRRSDIKTGTQSRASRRTQQSPTRHFDPGGSRFSDLRAGGQSRTSRRTQQSPIRPLEARDSTVDEDPSATFKYQPETRPISQEQLVAEVKGIYAGLVMVESKCIEVDNVQATRDETSQKLSSEQWQALCALHRTLLHEHHDFFLASQHPSASQALRRLAAKYAMPARMWRHGIHSFLELLRRYLPGSLEHMLTYIYIAYSMIALLYETVPAFDDTWIECLGDLGRYRMAIEDEDIRDREVWTSVSRYWYSKAADKTPDVGRLYHHLAILSRPNALQQLFFYNKALCVAIPFQNARDSILTLYEPIMTKSSHIQAKLAPVDLYFVRAHAIFFSQKNVDLLETSINEFLQLLDNHIHRTTRRWLESGYLIATSNCNLLIELGNPRNPIFAAISPQPSGDKADIAMEGGIEEQTAPAKEALKHPISLMMRTHEIVMRRFGDNNVLPYLHVSLVFMHCLAHKPAAMACIEESFPWKLTSLLLNTLIRGYDSYERIQGTEFPGPAKKNQKLRALPEDYAMRSLLWAADGYFPRDWFITAGTDDDDRYFEVPSMAVERKERILWLAVRLAAFNKWLTYSEETHVFGVLPAWDIEIEPVQTLFAPGESPDRDDQDLPDAPDALDAPAPIAA